MTRGVDSRMVALAVPAALALAFAAPAVAVPSKLPTKTAPKQRFSLDTAMTPFSPPTIEQAKFSFTAPGHAGTAARLATTEHSFRFTPSGQSTNPKALSLALSSRVTAPSVDTSRAAAPVDSNGPAPVAYNVDLSVGWKGFAVNTGYRRAEAGVASLTPLARSEAVDIGLSYRTNNWRTSLQATAEEGSTLLLSPLERRYSVELGSAYLLNPRFSLSGGFRYKLAPQEPSLLDPNQSDKSVYFGTNLAF